MDTIQKEFAILKKGYKKLKKLESSDSYYPEREIFTESLRKFLLLNFTELNKENFLTLCDWISTFRPVPPFSFLVSISLRKTKFK